VPRDSPAQKSAAFVDNHSASVSARRRKSKEYSLMAAEGPTRSKLALRGSAKLVSEFFGNHCLSLSEC